MNKNRLGTAARTALSAAIALLFALPLIWIISATFTPTGKIASSLVRPTWGLFVAGGEPTLQNFVSLADSGFWFAFRNSVIVTVVSVVIGLVIVTFAAFALAVFDFRFKGLAFGVVVISFMIPFDAISMQLSLAFRSWGYANTFFALIVVGLAHGMAIFNLRQFFLNIPGSLIEASTIDGAGPLRILWQIYVPLSKPALVASGTLLFLGQWLAYLWPLLIASGPDVLVAPIALARAMGEHSVDYGRLMAGAFVLGVVPGLLLLSVQRVFIRSAAYASEK